MFKVAKVFFMYTVLAMLVFSCKKKSTTVELAAPDNYFVSATSAGTVSKADMQMRAGFAGFGTSVNSLINYDSEFIRIIYKTKYKGRVIEVSGLLGLPKNGPFNPSIISAQHETRFLSSSAPSLFPNASTGYEILAGMGYIVVIPDYIGFGASSIEVRPYFLREYAGLAVVDMIKAAKEYLKNQKISSSGRLFLLGYSEGGYATLAAQREIELNPSHQLTVTASAAGGGGFDLKTMVSEISSKPTYAGAAYLALMLNSYNLVYDWKRPLNSFFNEPYASNILSLLDGTKDSQTISSALTNDLSILLNPVFLADLKTEGKESILKDSFVQNSFFDWYPKGLTRLYHGTADEIVPYKSTQTTFDAFKAAGATNLTLRPLNGNHFNSATLMMADVLPWLISTDK
ncbi:MAG: lipase family protein [Bacteroidota bacterium]